MKKVIFTEKAQKPEGMPYSQAIKVGNTVYVAGQGPFDPATGSLVGNTLEDQARRTLDNVKAILEEAGATLKEVVKVTVLLGDGQDLMSLIGFIKIISLNRIQLEL
ncbi:reactive intermediate/imine deaminase [Paenibacillus sp. 1_12]|uniref:Rid family hydrolase n=1 Tax=Paenibacillus sp. 1_12 TaxID=1566278 RepID=UPI0008E12D42|nr:Rid family hydrolase [Paenibacillus sp. 1_12]SFL30916.1 reactive intermediate/imine deaminase [Paenibacillus sp. 1_12]